jgi:hypothetical protein
MSDQPEVRPGLIEKFKFKRFDEATEQERYEMVSHRDAFLKGFNIIPNSDSSVTVSLMTRIRHLEDIIAKMSIQGVVGDTIFIDINDNERCVSLQREINRLSNHIESMAGISSFEGLRGGM